MSGHSHWAGIKHKKGATDQKRGQIFSKLLAAVSVAAKHESNPDFNPRLRAAVDKAKENKVPAENIERALTRAADVGGDLEELVFEAYGPGGAAILIEAVSDNKNRTVQEIKTVLKEFGGKWAESGSVLWAFATTADQRGQWSAKFPQEIGAEDRAKLAALVNALEEHDDVLGVYTSAKSE